MVSVETLEVREVIELDWVSMHKFVNLGLHGIYKHRGAFSGNWGRHISELI